VERLIGMTLLKGTSKLLYVSLARSIMTPHAALYWPGATDLSLPLNHAV